jgi:hypothetical protein
MAQRINSQSASSHTRAVLSFSLVLLLGTLSDAAWRQTDLSCAAMKLALGTLSSAGLSAWEAIHSVPCAQWVLDGFQHIFAALCPLFANLAAALW